MPSVPLATCEKTLATTVPKVSAVHAGKSVVHEPAFSQCVAALREAASTCVQPNIGCLDAWDGTVAENGACNDPIECVRGDTLVTCLKPVNAAGVVDGPGACRKLRRARLGEACIAADDGRNYSIMRFAAAPPPLAYCDARDGLFCSTWSTPDVGVCAQIVAQGAACDRLDCLDGICGSCGPAMYCDGTCKPINSLGATCSSDRGCQPWQRCTNGACAAMPFATQTACNGVYE
jgi:hypothetical protein